MFRQYPAAVESLDQHMVERQLETPHIKQAVLSNLCIGPEFCNWNGPCDKLEFLKITFRQNGYSRQQIHEALFSRQLLFLLFVLLLL
jgi:hypothetical protein